MIADCGVLLDEDRTLSQFESNLLSQIPREMGRKKRQIDHSTLQENSDHEVTNLGPIDPTSDSQLDKRKTSDHKQGEGEGIFIVLANLSPLNVTIMQRMGQKGEQITKIAPPTKSQNNCLSNVEIEIKVGATLYAVQSEDPKRRLVLGGKYETKLTSKEWSKDKNVMVPITCKPQKFQLIDDQAYSSNHLEDWCY